MNARAVVVLLVTSCLPVFGQLSRDQKVSDMSQLIALFWKHYAPYEWKRDTQGFDLAQAQPWLERAAATKTDEEFKELLIEYVSKLNDAHVALSFPSTLVAQLPFDVDIYDGKVLIEWIHPFLLPARLYPFEVGDELVSVDGVEVEEWIRHYSVYSMSGNPRSTARAAANRIVSRSGSHIPSADKIGETATVVIRRATGDLETYEIPWQTIGEQPKVGPLPDMPRTSALDEVSKVADDLPDYMLPVAPFLKLKIRDKEYRGVAGLGDIFPIFRLPENFELRLGLFPSDAFFSGVYEADGLRIGYIRIPTFEPEIGATAALRQFDEEIAFMRENTDGLILDVMRNPGGILSYCEALLQRVIPYQFRTLGFEIRATSNWVAAFSASYEIAK
jgi:Periplasmic protease